MHAAIIPALETQVGFSTLSRVSSSNNWVLYKDLNTSVTKQYTDRVGGTVEVSFLRAPNVFHTGQSNTLLTYLLGPVFYPYQADSVVTSLHALGGGPCRGRDCPVFNSRPIFQRDGRRPGVGAAAASKNGSSRTRLRCVWMSTRYTRLSSITRPRFMTNTICERPGALAIIWVRKGEAASSATWPVRRLSETSFQMQSA